MRKAILYGPGMFQQAYKFLPRCGLVKGNLRTIHIQQEEFIVGKERCMGIFGNDGRFEASKRVPQGFRSGISEAFATSDTFFLRLQYGGSLFQRFWRKHHITWRIPIVGKRRKDRRKNCKEQSIEHVTLHSTLS